MSVQKVSSHVIWKMETFIEENTRHIVHRKMKPQSPSKVPWDLTRFSQSPSAAPLYFPESHQQSGISSLWKVILVLEEARSRRAPNLGCRETESPGWLDVSPKNSAQDVMHEQVHSCDEAANQQLPIAAAFWIIWIVSMEECSSFMQNLMQMCCCTCSVILNARASQYTCSLNGVYPPPLTSTVKFSLFTHVHSSSLSLTARFHQCCANHSLYINNG